MVLPFILVLPFTLFVTNIRSLEAFIPTHPALAHIPTFCDTGNLLKAKAFTETNLQNKKSALEHSDITWKVRPSEDSSLFENMRFKAMANLLRLDYCRGKMKPHLILCPPGEKVLLEAWYKGSRKIGRFGITCKRGPSFPPIEETVQELYGNSATAGIGIAAIIYMYVEPDYRGMGVGKLALEIIGIIHAACGADFTILVADDKSDTRALVKWYETLGYSRAPKLQEFMGSPNEEFGVAMIAPTRLEIPQEYRIEWW